MVVPFPRWLFRVIERPKNLTINRNSPPDDPQYREYCHENSLGSDPFVEIEPDKKTKNNTTGHGQADLHHNRQVFSPGAIFFITKNHLNLCQLEAISKMWISQMGSY
jgi:hypothetical protein